MHENKAINKVISSITGEGKDEGKAISIIEYNNIKPDASIWQGSRSTTLFHYAAGYGAIKLVYYLSDRIQDTTIQNGFGNTALHCAALNGHCEIVSFLISISDPDVTNFQGKIAKDLAEANYRSPLFSVEKKTKFRTIVKIINVYEEERQSQEKALKESLSITINKDVSCLMQTFLWHKPKMHEHNQSKLESMEQFPMLVQNRN